MDHIGIIKRAFHITWTYRALWVFGILLALTGGGWNVGNSSNWGSGGGRAFERNLEGLLKTPEFMAVVLSIAVVLIGLGFILAVGFTILRYVSETAAIRMVDQHESIGERAPVSQGFRWGWSRQALRMFLIDLIVGLSLVVGAILLLLIAAAPLLLWLTRNEVFGVIGTVATVLLGLFMLLVIIAAAVCASVLLQFFRRACVLEDLGVFAAMRRGLALVRLRLGDVVLMALILFGIGLGWFILMIPVFILLGLLALLLGGLPGVAAGLITSLFTEGVLPWIVGLLISLPIFFLVVGVPMLFLNGLFKAFISSSWTLTYREVHSLAPPPSVPEEGAPDVAQVDSGGGM